MHRLKEIQKEMAEFKNILHELSQKKTIINEAKAEQIEEND